MQRLNETTHLIDLLFLGRPGVIGTAVLETSAGVLLVDPGPTTCLPTLRRELEEAGVGAGDVHGLLITHIHLDHAGASGTIVREWPHVAVYVHQRGATHMADPAKLEASARRLYGADMDRLWGELAPVPVDRLRILEGGEALEIGGRPIGVAYTPGHASHHVSYFDESTGMVCTGDTAGIRVGSLPYALPPTPPPDIDPPLWRASLDRIGAWRPSSVYVTHFGLHADAEQHLALVREELDWWERLSGQIVEEGGGDDEQASRFASAVGGRMTSRVGEKAATYMAAVPLEHCWMGLSRFWNRQRRNA